jgi:hypothetical protein
MSLFVTVMCGATQLVRLVGAGASSSWPIVRPGTPEAQAQGRLCRFESNMEAAFLPAERGHEDETIVVIHQDCPLHKIVTKPTDDALGEL